MELTNPLNDTNLPKALVDNVRDGRAFLFLGAGASMGAIHPKSKRIPTGEELTDLIIDKFLGPEYKGRSLSQAAELAISEHDLYTVQEFIASQFRDFEPADFHKLIAKFVWPGIATTNFDLIVERAYNAAKSPMQIPVAIKKDGESIEEKLRSQKNVIYLKLHGCISSISDPDLPLILTPDQYIDHRKKRVRLFDKVRSFAYEYPFIFIGYSLGDTDIRAILHELDELQEAKPRSYVVTPNMTPAEVNFWQGKKFTHIPLTFKDFLEELDNSIPPGFRALSTLSDKSEAPINKRLTAAKGAGISESLATFLSRDVEYLSSDYKTEKPNPKAFYKGFFVDWSPILGDLDVRRSITSNILAETFLPDEGERREGCEFVMLKGHAGSGKSVVLKRLAWEASLTYDKLCLFAKQGSFIEYEPISELYRLCKERIFLFLDPVTEFSELIDEIIPLARKDKIPLTIIGAERFNEWNELCTQLDPYVSHTYELPYLDDVEIEGLIALLKTHKSLGHLDGKSLDEQKDELGKRAGRQILVALHEATLGKPFADIVLDEYNSVLSPKAQSLYLTTCIFHRLNVPVRAGLISRIHKISFLEFKEELFTPLQDIVFVRMNEKIQDYEYRTRHSHIAEMVFERVLVKPQARFDEYMRIIGAIDVDYSSDREAFKGITNARELLELFPNPQMIRQIYAAAGKRDPNNPMLLQQEAIFEMNSSNGSLVKAAQLLHEANRLAPYLKPIIHSLAELSRKQAEQSTNTAEKQRLNSEAKRIASDLIARGANTAHPYTTLINIGLDDLEKLITSSSDTASLARQTNELESLIATTIQRYPDDSFVRDAEYRFCDLINKHERALKALEQGFVINKRNAYIASRLAKIYARNGAIDRALVTLKDCLELTRDDKEINFQLAMLLDKLPGSNRSEIRHHLRRAFTDGDTNYVAQFWYARHIYIDGDVAEALTLFQRLGNINIDSRIKHLHRGVIMEDKKAKRFEGMVLSAEVSYAYIIRDGLQDKIYAYVDLSEANEWSQLRYHKRVVFDLGFNYYGPIALNVIAG